MPYSRNTLHIVVMSSDSYNLRLQQEVLSARERAINLAVPEARTAFDEAYFSDLLAVSPDKLIPVLVQRNHEDWFAGYLIQSIGMDGMRLLVKDDTWRITRVKRTATVIPVGRKARQRHLQIVEAQRQLKTDISDLLAGINACKITKSKKGSNTEVIRKSLKGNGSSRANKSMIF